MELWKKLKSLGGLKIAGIIIAGLIVLIVLSSIIKMAVIWQTRNAMVGNEFTSFSGYEMADSTAGESAAINLGARQPSLSSRNVVGKAMPTNNTKTAGANAEAYEVTEYNATIMARQLADTCQKVAELKALDYVIFESANNYRQSCNYTFKVKKANTEEILVIIKGLKPRDLNENVYTIKNTVDDFTSEIEILRNKKTSIDETLGKAIISYDEVAVLATNTKDVESLAKIIDSKLNLISRLADERLKISSELERLARVKAEQLDRLEYTRFQINVYENKFIDGQKIKDSWQAAIKNFVQNINETIQAISVNLLTLILVVIPYVLYFIIILIIVKNGWKAVKYLWQR